jgi:response regulator RpfG family c-di-GMP phosphodiesterase
MSSPILVEQLTMGDGREVCVQSDPFFVGRNPDCHLCISHASISRKHASIRQENDRFVLYDLNSKNGVFVNGFRISQPSVLNGWDRLRFGDITYVFKTPQDDSALTGVSLPETDPAEHSPRMEMLLEMSKLINSSLILSDVLDKVMDAVIDITHAQRGFLMISENNGKLEIKVARNLETSSLKSEEIKISMSSVQRVYQDNKSFISVDIDSDSRLSSQQSIMSLGLKSVMCVPMSHRGRIIGVVYVDSHNVARGFNDEDLQILEALADHAAIAIENARLVETNREMMFSTIKALAEAIEQRDPSTGGHTQRVLELCLDLGVALGMDAVDLENLKMSSLLHDIGKIGVDDNVLRKHSELIGEEFDTIRRHPQIGADIIQHIPNSEGIVPGILLHHERYDGSGYPFGHSGDQIPLQAKIIAVADSFDAMVSHRPYRDALPYQKALAELDANSGTQFDPEIVEVFKVVIGNNLKKYRAYYPSAFPPVPS